MTDPYHREQAETLFQVHQYIGKLDGQARRDLMALCAEYIQFRRDDQDSPGLLRVKREAKRQRAGK